MCAYVTHTQVFLCTLYPGYRQKETHAGMDSCTDIYTFNTFMTWNELTRPSLLISSRYCTLHTCEPFVCLTLDYITPHYTPWLLAMLQEIQPPGYPMVSHEIIFNLSISLFHALINPHQLRAPDCDALLRHQLGCLDHFLQRSSRIPRRGEDDLGPWFKTRSTE